jgi:hypothetical protein
MENDEIYIQRERDGYPPADGTQQDMAGQIDRLNALIQVEAVQLQHYAEMPICGFFN